jgi:hypothetical protein
MSNPGLRRRGAAGGAGQPLVGLDTGTAGQPPVGLETGDTTGQPPVGLDTGGAIGWDGATDWGAVMGCSSRGGSGPVRSVPWS